jgi:hypothetical protein
VVCIGDKKKKFSFFFHCPPLEPNCKYIYSVYSLDRQKLTVGQRYFWTGDLSALQDFWKIQVVYFQTSRLRDKKKRLSFLSTVLYMDRRPNCKYVYSVYSRQTETDCRTAILLNWWLKCSSRFLNDSRGLLSNLKTVRQKEKSLFSIVLFRQIASIYSVYSRQTEIDSRTAILLNWWLKCSPIYSPQLPTTPGEAIAISLLKAREWSSPFFARCCPLSRQF